MPYLLLVALGAGLLLQSAPRVPPRDNPVPTPGTASVSGRVIDKDSGRPLGDASVQLVLAAPMSIREARSTATLTDANGRYHITGLAAGGYTVMALPGMHRGTHRQFILGRRGEDDLMSALSTPSLQLSAGEIREDLDIALERTFAIEGRVLNEFGEPMAEVSVVAERHAHGEWRDASHPSATDDRGMFRVFQLPPGEYRLCARPQRMHAAATDGTVLGQRFVNTCNPATVRITTGDAAGVDIQMHRTGTFTLSGRVLNAAGVLASDAQVLLAFIEKTRSSSSNMGVVMRDGVFTVKGVLPGDYVIKASTGITETPGGHEVREAGFLALRVEAADITGLVVSTSPGASLRGRVRVEGGPLDAHTVRRLRVQAQPDYRNPVSRSFGGPPVYGRVLDDLTFELRQVLGAHTVRVENLPDGWYFKRATYRGTDITDRLTEFTSSDDPNALQIVLSNSGAHVSARVRDAEGHATFAAAVFLIPADAQPGQAARPRGAEVRRSGGVIELGLQRPGDYLVFALSLPDANRLWNNPGLIDSLSRTAQPVTLREGDRLTLDLRVLALPSQR